MRKRETIGWLLMIFQGFIGSYLGWQLRVCKAEKLHAAEVIFQCGEDLEKSSAYCSAEGAEYMKRGNLIFECQESICEVNGWTKPYDFDDGFEEYEKHKEQP